MKNYIQLLFALIFSSTLFGQTYNIMDNDGQTIVGCSGIFTDSDNGSGGATPYGHNENYTVTFCPDNGSMQKVVGES